MVVTHIEFKMFYPRCGWSDLACRPGGARAALALALRDVVLSLAAHHAVLSELLQLRRRAVTATETSETATETRD